MNNFQIDRAIKSVMELLSNTNAYVDSQAPWSLKKTNHERMNVVLFIILNIIIKCSIMLIPIIPSSTSKVLSCFNIQKKLIGFQNFEDLVDYEITVNKPKPIFPRIDE